MSLSQRLLKFLAARFHIEPGALDYFFASQHIGRGAETRFPYPAELVPIGARLVLRGWLNHRFFPAHRDWILPYWAEQQFDPRNRAFIPYGFDLYTINYTHRDWTMIGNLGRAREAIVDPRGLVTPWFDGWSLDVWLEVDGKLFAPSRLPETEVEQSLRENLPIVVTKYRAGEVQVALETFAAESNEREWVVENIAITNASAARRITVYLAFRPFNPEGVSLINEISLPGEAGAGSRVGVRVNSALGAIIPPPDSFATSTLDRGDIAHQLQSQDNSTSATDKSGLATAVAAYHLDLGSHERKTISARMPMTREEIQEDDPDPVPSLQSLYVSDLRLQIISNWHSKLSRGMRVRLPDERLQSAFEANKAYLLLLHDGDTITPGPFTYHQFWMRDAAYLLNALDKLGYHDETRAVIEKFPKRIQKDGFVRSTEGEWDSNGAAIWTMLEHARLSGDNELLMTNYWLLLRMASWINSKRRQTKDHRQRTNTSLRGARRRSNLQSQRDFQSPITNYQLPSSEIVSSQQTLLAMTRVAHLGLLPPGPSAEHLGPADYFYWDDFWGLAGLNSAARAAEVLGETQDAIKLRANADTFRADIEASLAMAASRLGRQALPASPYRRLDAGSIGSLVSAYPLRLFDPRDARIVDTLAALKENAWMEDAYFNHAGHAALGTYLSLHIAQCLLMQRNADAWKIINWVLRHASPTFTWAEGIHPGTRRGGMGDGHHGWAAADFILAIRNALLVEEENHLVITPVLPQDWVLENNVVKVENAATYFGDVSFTIAFGDRTATLVVRSDWRTMPEYIEWCLPFTPREAGDDAQIVGNAVRLPRGSSRTVVTW